MYPSQMFQMNSNINQNMNLNSNQNISLNNNNMNINNNQNMNVNNNQNINLINNQNMNLNNNQNMNLINNQNMNLNNSQNMNTNINQNMNLNNNQNMNTNINQNMNFNLNNNMNSNNNQFMSLNNNQSINSNINQNMNSNINQNMNSNINQNINLNNNSNMNLNYNQNMNLNNQNMNINNNQAMNQNNNINKNLNYNQDINLMNNKTLNILRESINNSNNANESIIHKDLSQNNNEGFNNLGNNNNYNQNSQQGFNNMGNNSFNNNSNQMSSNISGQNFVGQNINYQNNYNQFQNQFSNQQNAQLQNNNLNNNLNVNNELIISEIKNIEKIVNDLKASIQTDINYIKNNVSDIQQKINNANLDEIKSSLNFIKSEVGEFRKVLQTQNQNKEIKEDPKNIISNKLNFMQINEEDKEKIKNDDSDNKEILGMNIGPIIDPSYLNNNINQNINLNNNDMNNNKINIIGSKKNKFNKNNDKKDEKKVIISMNGIENSIMIKNNISLEQFRTLSKKHFKLNNDTILFYYNKFATKIIIQNDLDFKNSLAQNIIKYYFTNEKKENKNDFIKSPGNIFKNDQNQPFINNFNFFQPNVPNYNNNNINLNLNNKDNNASTIMKNDIIKIDESKVDEYKKEVKDVMDHFASFAFIPSDIKKEDFVNSAVYLSDMMNKINIIEKKNCPQKLISPKTVMQYPGLISKKFEKKDQIFTLSLISNILEEKGINVNIYKENESNNKIDGANLQYLFNGFTEKKKYEVKFNLENNKTNILLKKGNELNNFIDEWKTKISNQLNIDEDELYLVNPKYNSGFSLDLITEEGNVKYNKLKNFKEIKEIDEKPLIEGCQLNTDIFDPNNNNQDPNWGKGEKRAGLDYIPPLGWFGYGLKVSKKYDNGNNNWLDYKGVEGEFAVAYFGLSNIYGNKKNMNLFLNEINSKNALNAGYEQLYKNDDNVFEGTKDKFQKCGAGVYLFQNPEIAENTAGIIDIGGVRYKVLLMCRVNPKKIRQPKGFKDCWILNPLPSEIRPYRILVKKIFQSPLAGASQNEIKTFLAPPEYFKDIIIKKDTSFLLKNPHTIYNNDYDYVINLYTTNEYRYINNYLREGKIGNNSKYTEKELKSWAWCLHNALTTRKSTVSNGTIYYRGVSLKFTQNLGIGSKFIFGEFTSVSEDKGIALGFAGNGTLFIIRIENNNYPNCYCNKISDLSAYKHEKEILITSNCTYSITKIDNKNKDNDSVDIIHLTCEGFNDHSKEKIKKLKF